MTDGRTGGAPQLRATAARVRTVAAALALIALASGARAGPANTLQDLSKRLQTCLAEGKTTDELANGSEVTILFALRRDGTLMGRPTITHSDLRGDPDDQKRFLAAVIGALDQCLPLDITPGLGGAIAGRPVAVRIIKGRWQVGA
jgi:hypothetical protein